MNIKHIQDQVENYGFMVALEAFQMGMQHAKGIYNSSETPTADDIKDRLLEMAKQKLQGGNA